MKQKRNPIVVGRPTDIRHPHQNLSICAGNVDHESLAGKYPEIALLESLYAMQRAKDQFRDHHNLSFAIHAIEHHLCDLLFRHQYPAEEAREAIKHSIKMAFSWMRYLERRAE